MVLALYTGVAYGQAPSKIAHVSTQELMIALPETKLAAAQLEAYTQSWKDQYSNITDKLDKLVKDYNASVKTLDDKEKAARQAEAQSLEQQQQGLQQQAQTAVDKKRQELYGPLVEKVNKTIAALAVEKGYDYVMDAGTGTVIWVRPGSNDLTADVRLKLGLK